MHGLFKVLLITLYLFLHHVIKCTPSAHKLYHNVLRMCFCFVSELNEKNVLNVLRKAKVSAEDWYTLGTYLVKDNVDLRAIRSSFINAGRCMIDMLGHWLRIDLNASWGSLANALDNVTGFGAAAAAMARQNTGIGKTNF